MKSIVAKTLRKIVSAAAVPLAKKYVQKDRTYNYEDLSLKVFKDVFHPGLFRSTKVFAEWMNQQSFQNKMVLEIGSGSGLISLVAAKNGAIVTATDINTKATENTKLNAFANRLNITVIQSDLFAAVPLQLFDMILVNPPYYPQQPQNDYEKAWYCGIGFDYFKKFFKQLKDRGLGNNCYMILSDTCDLESIRQIAGSNKLELKEVYIKKRSGEQLTIYQTSLTGHP